MSGLNRPLPRRPILLTAGATDHPPTAIWAGRKVELTHSTTDGERVSWPDRPSPIFTAMHQQ